MADGPDVLIDDGTSEIEYRAICPKCYAEYAADKRKGGVVQKKYTTGAK